MRSVNSYITMVKRPLFYSILLLMLASCHIQEPEPEPLWMTINQFEWQPDGEHVIAMASIEYIDIAPSVYSYFKLSSDGSTREKLSNDLFMECGRYPMHFYLRKDGTQALVEECRAIDRFSVSTRSSTEFYIPIQSTHEALIAASPDLKYAFLDVLDNTGKGLSPKRLFTVVDLSGKTYRTVSQDSFPGMNLLPSGGMWLDEGHFAVEGNLGSTDIGIVIIDTSCKVKGIIPRNRDNSSDGCKMFYISSQRTIYYTDQAQLYKYSLDDSSIVAFNIGKVYDTFEITPDGEYIIFQRSFPNDGLYVKNIKTAAVDTIYNNRVTCFRVSPDGTKVAYSESYNGEFVPLTTVEIPRP